MTGMMTPGAPDVQAIGPEDLNTAANDGTYITMKDLQGIHIYIEIGEPAGGAAAVTVEQATSLAAAGEKAVTFTKYYQKGQKLKIDGQSGTFSVGETIEGGSSSNTAKVIKISSGHLIVAIITGSTTWTDNEEITGATSGATANVNGTGESEDMVVEMTATSNTFNTLAVAFTNYLIPIDASMLDVANGFDCCHVKIAQAASGETQGCAYYRRFPKKQIYPAISSVGAVKVV